MKCRIMQDYASDYIIWILLRICMKNKSSDCVKICDLGFWHV